MYSDFALVAPFVTITVVAGIACLVDERRQEVKRNNAARDAERVEQSNVRVMRSE